MLALQLLRGLQRARNHRAVSDDGEVGSGLYDLSFPERNHVVGAGIGGASVGFTVEALMFEEQDGVVAADRSAQQARGIERIGREDHAQAGSMREDAFAALRVVNRATRQITADRDADHHRRRKGVVRTPADDGKFVAQLHHRRPDVIEELDLNHRLQAANGHPGGAADDGGFCQRRIEYPVGAELDLQARRQLEDSALSFYLLLLQVLLATGVGYVLPEDEDTFV